MLAVDAVLRCEVLGKRYARRPEDGRARISGQMLRALVGLQPRRRSPLRESEFWAVKDIDISLRRGEALGIIGLNGSGKTTLLRMLAGQILPDAGRITVAGTTAAMIDLTAGFDMTRSGAENVYLRGSALGRSESEIQKSFDEIIAFAELGDAVNAPVRSYSSGMIMRLAFSIMVSVDPDILFIDEVLAVGDFRFRQKCLAKLRQLRERSSFIMVSHSMGDIRAFCTRVMVLNRGRVVFEGEPGEAVEVYENLQFGEEGAKEKKAVALLAPQYTDNDSIGEVEHYWCDLEGRPRGLFAHGDPVCFKVTFVLKRNVSRLILGVPVWAQDGAFVTGFSTKRDNSAPTLRRGERCEFLMTAERFALNEGVYLSNLGIMDGAEFLHRLENPPLEISRRAEPNWGVVSLPHSWKRIT